MPLQRLPRAPRTTAGALVLLALTLGACATTSSLPPRGQVVMRDVSFPLRDFRLPSGLRVVVEQDTRAPVVAVVALVGAGGSSDPSGKEGLAHVVEHLAFRARHAGAPSVWTRLEASGAGSFNAFTSLDHTVYQTLAPKEALPALLKLEAQRLAAPIEGVTPEVFAVEREVVRNELRQRNETGYVGQVFSWMNAVAFPADHPYARPLAGTHESLSALTLGDAVRFARTHYRPDNVTLVIAGDVDLADIEVLLKQALPPSWQGTGAPLTPSARLPPQPPEPPLAPAPKALVVHEAAVTSPELYLTWVLPRGFDETSAVQEFVRAVLAPNLWRAAVQVDGDIAGIDTGLVRGTRASLLVVRVALNKGDHPERSAESVLDQVYETWNPGASANGHFARESDFQSMRRAVVIGMTLEAEDLLARATRRAELTHFLLDVRAYSRSQAALAALDGGKVTDFAYKWLQRERARTLLVRPGENGVAALEAPALLLPDEGTPAAPAPAPAALARLAAPVQVLRLDNGVEVLLAPRPGLPVVHVGVALGGGSVSGTKPGVADLAYWGAFPESRYEGSPGSWGLRSTGWLERDQLRYEMAGAAGNVGNMLALLAERLGSMRTAEAIVRYHHEQVAPWRQALDARPEVRARRQLLQALYGEHPFGREATSTELTQLSWGEAQEWLEQVHRPANAVVVIAGEFDAREVEALARKYLGGWRGGEHTPMAAPPEPPLPAAFAQPKLLVTPRPGATQGAVQVACRLPAATPETEARYALMAEVARDRLWRQVREQRGATYGFSASASLARGGAAHLWLASVVDASRMGDAVATVHQTLAAYAREGVPTAELERARARLLAQEAVAFVPASAWVDALLEARMLGFPPEAVARRPDHLRAVTAAQLQQDFAGCLERLVVGLTGDEAQARASLQAVRP